MNQQSFPYLTMKAMEHNIFLPSPWLPGNSEKICFPQGLLISLSIVLPPLMFIIHCFILVLKFFCLIVSFESCSFIQSWKGRQKVERRRMSILFCSIQDTADYYLFLKVEKRRMKGRRILEQFLCIWRNKKTQPWLCKTSLWSGVIFYPTVF